MVNSCPSPHVCIDPVVLCFPASLLWHFFGGVAFKNNTSGFSESKWYKHPLGLLATLQTRMPRQHKAVVNRNSEAKAKHSKLKHIWLDYSVWHKRFHPAHKHILDLHKALPVPSLSKMLHFYISRRAPHRDISRGFRKAFLHCHLISSCPQGPGKVCKNKDKYSG